MEMELLNTIGNVGGPIAVAAVVWLYMRIKDIEKRLGDGNMRFSKQEETLNELRYDMNTISKNVEYIRGFLEQMKKGGDK